MWNELKVVICTRTIRARLPIVKKKGEEDNANVGISYTQGSRGFIVVLDSMVRLESSRGSIWEQRFRSGHPQCPKFLMIGLFVSRNNNRVLKSDERVRTVAFIPRAISFCLVFRLSLGRERLSVYMYSFYLSGGRCMMSCCCCCCGGGLEDGCGSASQVAWRRLADGTSHLHWLHERWLRLMVRLQQPQLLPRPVVVYSTRLLLILATYSMLWWVDERWWLLLLLLMMEDVGVVVAGVFGQ